MGLILYFKTDIKSRKGFKIASEVIRRRASKWPAEGGVYLHTDTMTNRRKPPEVSVSSTCNSNESIHSHTQHYTESMLTVLLCRRCWPRWPVRGIVGEFPSLRERVPSSPPTRRRGLRERWEMEVRGREEWNKRKMRLDQSKPPSKSKPPKTPKQIIRKCIWEFYLVPKILICHLLMCLLKYNNIATKDQFKARHYKQNYWLNLRFCFHNVVIFLFYYYT